MHLSSVIIGACLLAIGANADPVKGTIFYGKCDKQTNMCVMINTLRPDTNWSLPCKYLCHVDGADCWYATDRTVSGVRWPPSTDMVSCSNNNMPQGHKRPLIFPDPESFRPFFKPLENFPDFSKLGGRRAVKFKA
ncbi:hypothetical protein CGCF415_v011758 [Colletotrichum fructicola]|uniref:Uncharacterized protein n=1 Tax=Colletotrichum fructicola (strain Nara gc5) TaxID=1213859 RepID=L2FN20_COLFN|nr:uncharacterized protein CGMCC3_g3322 [Colletotrichum fructicola]KAF4479901.1 hypothetical protein CGGC5_v012661 [Colletotrichum fructicola Nara gc5]KAI8290472.1 hypothetical protein K4K60_005565 [Colletotrichum sp. SAR11_57]KAE9580717.1 hypothetical protein CGMCC3_g3322 [Colletotrichum fructicola]KAF4422985.1 hypothetical protein CFRS1_v001215 [Colletotrichum fructicola]KAF4896053.1 hypothetical protein CGCF415_v011758 [Colletotrichum fructicola]